MWHSILLFLFKHITVLWWLSHTKTTFCAYYRHACRGSMKFHDSIFHGVRRIRSLTAGLCTLFAPFLRCFSKESELPGHRPTFPHYSPPHLMAHHFFRLSWLTILDYSLLPTWIIICRPCATSPRQLSRCHPEHASYLITIWEEAMLIPHVLGPSSNSTWETKIWEAIRFNACWNYACVFCCNLSLSLSVGLGPTKSEMYRRAPLSW